MSRTAHCVSEDWTLKSKCVETTFVPDSHTTKVLAGVLLGGIEQKKIACIAADSGANIIAAVQDLQWPWLKYFGHSLNMAIKNALHKET